MFPSRASCPRLPGSFKLLAPRVEQLWAQTFEKHRKETVNRIGKRGIWLALNVEKPGLRDKKLTVLADSGSSWSLLSDSYREYALTLRDIPPDIILVSASGNRIIGTKIGLFCIKIGNTRVTTDFFLVDNSVPWNYTILGLSVLENYPWNP